MLIRKLFLNFVCFITVGCNFIVNPEDPKIDHSIGSPVKAGPYHYVISNSDTGFPSYMQNVSSITCRIPQADKPLPVIIVEPGFFSSITQLDDVQNRLASHGFLVIGVNNTSHFNLITTNLDPYKLALLETVQYAFQSTAESSHPLHGKVDTSAIGIMGHSLGGGGVLMACDSITASYNKYIKTAIAMNPYGKCSGSNIKIPVMLFSSDLDNIVNPFMPGGAASPENVYFSFNSIKSGKAKLFANFKNMDHNGVIDTTQLFATGGNAGLFLPTIVAWFKTYLAMENSYQVYLNAESEQFKSLKDRFIVHGTVPSYQYDMIGEK
jgi:dienelactone hydrolase